MLIKSIIKDHPTETKGEKSADGTHIEILSGCTHYLKTQNARHI